MEFNDSSTKEMMEKLASEITNVNITGDNKHFEIR